MPDRQVQTGHEKVNQDGPATHLISIRNMTTNQILDTASS